MKNLYLLSSCFMLSLFLISCAEGQQIKIDDFSQEEFDKYWYNGEAELARYELKQARYGELHKGEAVLIFVTEEFREDKQVKFEGGDRNNVVPILKLNFTRKFFTGLYPYSLMSSVFTPVDKNKPTIKVTTSAQEWCGHTFMQINLDKKKYKSKLFSYFQNEGDTEFNLPMAVLEDEVWTRIRLNPAELPTGKVRMIPNTQHLRMRHLPIRAESATATLGQYNDENLSNKPMLKYSIDYSSIQRELAIIFENEFPFKIISWSEKVKSGFGSEKSLVTTGVLTNTLKSPYWNHNSVSDAHLRKELGLESSNH
ncbi:MAG: septum formation inhibitor Maf [Saprospiraceae bacterium]|nr:septum formation inhibitor Maf [Saprospiraceae bacterium]